MKGAGYFPNLILIPANLQIDFINFKDKFDQNATKQFKDFKNLVGLYDGIPVISPFGKILENELIIVDTRSCKLIQIEDLNIEVEELNLDDKKEYPHIDNKELDLSVIIKITEEYKFNILEKKAILKLEL